MNCYKYILFIYTILFANLAIQSQSVLQKKVDSMQRVLDAMDTSDVNKVTEIGEYILANSNSDIQKYDALGVVINAYAVKNEKQKSIHYLFKAKEIAETLDHPEKIVRVYGTLASLYASLDLNDKAKDYIERSRQHIQRLPNGIKKHHLNAFIYSETGTMYYNIQNYGNANANFKKSMDAFDEIVKLDSTAKHSFYYRNTMYNLGKSYVYIDQPDSADLYLNKALMISSPQQSYLKYYIKTSLSELYTSNKDYKRSIDTLKGIINDPAFAIEELRSEIFLDLAQNYKALGDTVNYSLYNEKYVNINPQIIGEDLNAINSVFVAEENKYKSSISNSYKNNQLLLWGIIAILILSAISIYSIYKKNKKETHIYKEIIHGLKAKKTVLQDRTSIATDESSTVQINSSVEEDILKKLARFESTEQFTNTKLTLASLAVKLKTNNTYLSDIINREKGKNFNTYINQLRIDYICEKIHSDPKYLEYKISYLAETSGFNSHSVFATVFKNVTGISPSVFLKNARLQHSKNNNT